MIESESLNIRLENIMNQCRFLVLTISSTCIKMNSNFDMTKILKLLSKTSEGALKRRTDKLVKQKENFLIRENYFILLCWQLSLDHEENLMLFE